MKTTQRGFIVPLMLVIIAILLGGGAYVYTKTKQADQSVVVPSFSQTITTASGIYDISELGVQFTLPGTLADLTHKYVKLPGDQAVNSVEFSSKQLEAAGCGLETAPLGFLTYDNDKGGTVVGNARGSDLFYIKPNGQCKADASLQNWQELENAFKSLVTDFKATSAVQTASQSKPVGILLPSSCKIVGSVGDASHLAKDYHYAENTWLVDCGSTNNGNARATIGPVLIQQGWKFCESGLSGASWWKDGVTTGVFEGSSYPEGFLGLSQDSSPICQYSVTQTSNSQTTNWKTYTNTKYGFGFKYPSESKVSVRQDQNYQYIRIEKLGSVVTNYKDSISSGEYYLEIFIYDHTLGQVRDPRFCESILNPKKVELGMITGRRGNYSGGDGPGVGLAMCTERPEVDFDILGTESGKEFSILNLIFDSFKFTP